VHTISALNQIMEYIGSFGRPSVYPAGNKL